MNYRKDLEWFFCTSGLKRFIESEIDKSKKILDSYNKKIEFEDLENNMLSFL
jgi:hypothetical protein